MKGIFLSLLSGSFFKLLQLENSLVLHASDVNFGVDNSSKSLRNLDNHISFFLPIKQNGTERNQFSVGKSFFYLTRIELAKGFLCSPKSKYP